MRLKLRQRLNHCQVDMDAENDNSREKANEMDSDGVGSNGAGNSVAFRTLTRATMVVMKNRWQTTASGSSAKAS